MADEAWGNHGACVGSGSQPPDEPLINCSEPQWNDSGLNEVIELTECPEMCGSPCGPNSFCDCGTGTCHCEAGFSGPNCEVDLCQAARCGEHGHCTARYLGSDLPVTSDKACICEPGWTGPLCDKNPCLEIGRTCSGQGKCVAVGDFDTACECNLGFSGEECEVSCDDTCQGLFPYGCRSDYDGKVALGCHPNGGCYYLNPGEEYPVDGFCTFRTYDLDSDSEKCDCPAANDCQFSLPCSEDGTCPNPAFRDDGSSCNSVPWGVCIAGECVRPDGEIPPSNSTVAPTRKLTSPPTLSPKDPETKPPTEAPATKSPTRTPTKKPTKAPSQEPTKRPTRPPTPVPTTSPPTLRPTETSSGLSPCDGICLGEYPHTCTDAQLGKAWYACYVGGGCYYASEVDEPFPYDPENWCIYKWP